MTQVVMKQWVPGLRKIRLTKLLQARANLSLSEAHEKVGLLLNGESVEIIIVSGDPSDFIAEAASIGAIVEMKGASN